MNLRREPENPLENDIKRLCKRETLSENPLKGK